MRLLSHRHEERQRPDAMLLRVLLELVSIDVRDKFAGASGSCGSSRSSRCRRRSRPRRPRSRSRTSKDQLAHADHLAVEFRDHDQAPAGLHLVEPWLATRRPGLPGRQGTGQDSRRLQVAHVARAHARRSNASHTSGLSKNFTVLLSPRGDCEPKPGQQRKLSAEAKNGGYDRRRFAR